MKPLTDLIARVEKIRQDANLPGRDARQSFGYLRLPPVARGTVHSDESCKAYLNQRSKGARPGASRSSDHPMCKTLPDELVPAVSLVERIKRSDSLASDD
jgi:hypothetical protein